MKNFPIRIVQISDLHLFADKNKTLLGVNTTESFAALIKLLRSDPNPPRFIILSGDLSQDYTEYSYHNLVEVLKDFPIPSYYVAGNHDDSDIMDRILPQENISPLKHIVLEHWHIILLDSHQAGEVAGFLNAKELHFLHHCLQMYPEHHAIIVFHHHPVSVGSLWLDHLGLKNSEEFWAILKHYSKMNTILFGHVHQEHEGKKNGIHYYSTPSTCIQFKKNSAAFKLEKLGPAYRWLDLYPDGALKTGIKRVNHYIGVFEKDAKGY